MRVVTAVHGDTWDSIAYKTTGDEFMCDVIRQENAELYSDVIVFEGGERILVPDVVRVESKKIRTPWED